MALPNKERLHDSYIGVFVLHKTHVTRHLRSSQKLSSYEIIECLQKEKRLCPPFLCQSQDQRKERKHLALNKQQTPLQVTEVLSTTKTNGYKKSKNMNANWIRVKSSQMKCVQVILKFGWKKPKKSICVVTDVHKRQTVSWCSRLLIWLWHLYISSYFKIKIKSSSHCVFIAVCNLNYLSSQSYDLAFTNLKK